MAKNYTKTLKLKFHSDAGHGWLAVKRELIKDLGIADKITSYSYERGQSVYLEEDCDAFLFLETAKAKGLQFVIENCKPQNYSKIRNYPSYRNAA